MGEEVTGWGACLPCCRLTLPLWYPRGAWRLGLPPYPTFSLLFCPHPPAPLPGGKGEIFCFLMQGASPLASPGLSRKRHWCRGRTTCPAGACPVGYRLTLPLWCPAGGVLCLLPAYPAFGLLSCPLSPQPPFPAGRGRFFCFLMQGASPLASPGLSRKRHWDMGANRAPRGDLFRLVAG